MTLKKTLMSGLMAVAIGLFGISNASASVTTGDMAPNFTATDTKGNTVDLNALQGKTVVLEWINYGCPYVRKHYDSSNMQDLQAKYASDDNIAWIGVMSSAEGKEGYYDSDEAANTAATEENAMYTHLIRDTSGEIGKLYGASVTPHMFVIDDTGKLVYQGGIDDKPSASPKTLEGATNYVDEALTALKNGSEITVSDSKPYGCSVKY